MMSRLVAAVWLLATTAAVQQPTFRARVDHVLVDVVVTDRNDRPVTDLTAADFEIVESGRRQKITDFQFVSIPVSRTPLEADTRAARAAVVVPDVATNALPAAASRLFVLVIDDLHIIESEIVPVKKIVTDFVTSLAPDDEVGVVFTGRSDLGINLTRDRGRLLAAIDRIREAMGFGLDALHRLPGGGGDPEIDQLRKLNRIPINYAKSTARTVQNVASALAGSPHPRRAIVFVSGGVAIDPNASLNAEEFQWWRAVRQDLLDTFGKARQASVPIYTLDPRGHTMPEDAVRGGIGTIGGLGPGSRSDAGPKMRAEIARRIRIQQNYLSEMAINTGGRAFINQSNLSKAVSEIVAENGSYYLLAYSPTPLARDGKFHDIEVKVRRDGVRVRGRDGYLAPSAEAVSTDPVERLNAAMTSAINVSGIALRAVATPLAQGEKGMLTAVTLQVTYPLAPGSTAAIDDVLRVHISGLDPEAKVKASSEHAFTFKAQPINADHVTFLVNGLIELPAQPLTLRMAIASRSLGRAGMVQLPIEAPKRDESRLQMTGIAIGLEGSGEPALGGDVIRALVPFQPTTTRAFAAADTLRIFTRLFWESNASHQADLTFGVRGPSAIPSRTLPLSAIADGNRRQAAFETTLSLQKLVPGDYVLHVEARLPDGQTARRDVPFRVR
ncbi:MAG: VWA domain-containing protein [Vicinamibacterales bacterium]